MKNLLTITFLFIAGLAFAQPVRTTITDDGANVTISTPVNNRVVPICDFHWTFVDGQLQMWIEGRNELIPGGRLGNFTINGATTQASKLAALGAISAQCGGGGGTGGIDSLYLSDGTLLSNGDTIMDGNGVYGGSGVIPASTTAVVTDSFSIQSNDVYADGGGIGFIMDGQWTATGAGANIFGLRAEDLGSETYGISGFLDYDGFGSVIHETSIFRNGSSLSRITLASDLYKIRMTDYPEVGSWYDNYIDVGISALKIRFGLGDNSEYMELAATSSGFSYKGIGNTYNKGILYETDISDKYVDRSLVDKGYANNGTYTPTLFNTTNVAASTAFTCQWIKVGKSITVSGAVRIDATLAANTLTELGMSLPFSSDFVGSENLGGTASASDVLAGLVCPIKADATNNRALFRFLSTSLTNDLYSFSFTYVIL